MKKNFILFLTCLPALFQAQNLLNGLQACYPLDANANNYAATGPTLNGTLNNVSQATGHTSLANTAYRLYGDTGSYIKLPNDVRIKPNILTFSGWFYIDSLPNQQYLVYTKNNCSFNFEAYSLITYFDQSLNQQIFRVSKSNSACTYAPQVQSITSPVIGNWYHIVFYIDNSDIRLYVNSVLEGSTSHNILFDYNANKNVFLGGTHEISFNHTFKGRIDDVRFYDRALTQQEITLLYTQQSLCFSSVSVPEINTSTDQLSIYPNPGQGKFCIEHPGENSVFIYDVTGKKISFTKKQINETTTEINIEEVAPGLYFLQIFDAAGNYLQTSKIVVTK